LSPVPMSRLEAAVRVVLEFSEAFNRHDAPAMAALVAEDFVLEGSSLGAPAVSGRAAAEQHWQELFQRSPAAKIEIEELFGLGLRCVRRWKCAGATPCGIDGWIRGVDLFQLRQGLIGLQQVYIKGRS